MTKVGYWLLSITMVVCLASATISIILISKFASLNKQLSTISITVDRISSTIADVSSKADSLDSDVSDLKSSVDSLDSDIGDIKVRLSMP